MLNQTIEINMLEIRPSCEHCDKDLPFDSKEAYICTFECTYCKNCVEDILSHVCPNCGGNFQQRRIRPKELHEKYSLSRKRIHKPADLEKHKLIIQ